MNKPANSARSKNNFPGTSISVLFLFPWCYLLLNIHVYIYFLCKTSSSLTESVFFLPVGAFAFGIVVWARMHADPSPSPPEGNVTL